MVLEAKTPEERPDLIRKLLAFYQPSDDPTLLAKTGDDMNHKITIFEFKKKVWFFIKLFSIIPNILQGYLTYLIRLGLAKDALWQKRLIFSDEVSWGSLLGIPFEEDMFYHFKNKLYYYYHK